MRTLRCTYLALLSLTLLPCGLMAGNYAFGDLAGTAQIDGAITAPAASAPAPGQQADARQDIPPNNNEPGYNWPGADKSMQDWHFLRVSTTATYLKASSADTAALQDGTGKCKLDANTLYSLYSLPAFEGRHIVAHFLTPLPGCSFSRGYVYMPDVHSTSAGGKGLLPVNVRAFLDTLAFAEGTNEHYNYIYTFVTFTSYAKHPRKKICSGGLCSTAAGRYQFLTATWDALAADLALPDFTPPSQEKAAPPETIQSPADQRSQDDGHQRKG